MAQSRNNFTTNKQLIMNNEIKESFAQYGAKSMSEIGLLTLLGIPEAAARELWTIADGTLSAIAKMNRVEIARINGIGKGGAAIIIAAIELGRRRQTEAVKEKRMISSSLDMYDILHPIMRDATQEQFWIVLLDRRCKVIAVECIHIGGMASMVVDPKIIFQKALQYKASSIIISHNHPSGASSPSNEDIRLTEKIKNAGIFLDIKVLDHIIIGDGQYYSFADEGKI